MAGTDGNSPFPDGEKTEVGASCGESVAGEEEMAWVATGSRVGLTIDSKVSLPVFPRAVAWDSDAATAPRVSFTSARKHLDAFELGVLEGVPGTAERDSDIESA